MTPGAWSRAGMAGVTTGLDWKAVDVLLPQGVERGPVVDLLKAFEGGMLAGLAEKSDKPKTEG